MSFIETSDDIIDNSSKLLNDVVNSKFAQFLQGNGSPILVTYYHLDDTMSTTESGSHSIDDLIGADSPLRYNKITNFPVCGLKDLIPEKDALDGGLIDLSLDVDITIFPNTIKPNGLDYLLYVFPEDPNTHILFKITDFDFSSIRNNSYYKLSISLKEFNNWDYVYKLESQVIRVYRTNMDRIGTLDRCMIEDTTYEQIEKLTFVSDYLVREYLDLFYEERYNALIFRNDSLIEYPIFDPYLTRFIIQNRILEITNQTPYVLINYDYRDRVRRTYNKTLYRNLELHDRTQIYMFNRSPATFETNETNPFVYYGEEVVFSLDLHRHKIEDTVNDDDIHHYHHIRLIEGIMNYKEFKPFSGPTCDIVIPNIVQREPNNDNLGDSSNDEPMLISNSFDIMDYDEILIGSDNIDVPTDSENTTPPDISNSENDNMNNDTDNGTNPDDIITNDGIDDVVQEDTIEPVLVMDLPEYCNIIVKYLGKSNLYQLISDNDLEKLVSYDMEYSYESFIYIPMVIFIIKKYKLFLTDNKNK